MLDGSKSSIEISIHALLAESDGLSYFYIIKITDFYPRSPCGERLIHPRSCDAKPNFYPRSPCGERRACLSACVVGASISIHALLAESDPSVLHNSRPLRISIHALLAESDSKMPSMGVILISFLSTLSLRRATPFLSRLHSLLVYFYPRSPCGERPANWFDLWGWAEISIHALLAESDPKLAFPTPTRAKFLSTLSLRRATVSCNYFPFDIAISIHALLAESDDTSVCKFRKAGISIHALLAESDRQVKQICRAVISISIHALLAESDRLELCGTARHIYFYPRSPCGERRQNRFAVVDVLPISIHALLAESDACTTTITICTVSFLSTLSLRRAT